MRAAFALFLLLPACQSGDRSGSDYRCAEPQALCDDACRTKDRTTGGAGDYAQCLDNCRASSQANCR
jgi:hypothetical protein